MSRHTLQSHSLTTFNINKLYEHRLCATAVVFYYIGKSVLVENRPLIKFIRNYIRDLTGIFSISSLVRISMTSFPALTLLFVQKYSCPCDEKKITRWLEDLNLFSCGKKQYFTYSLRLLVKYCFYHSKIKFISSHHHVISSIYYQRLQYMESYF